MKSDSSLARRQESALDSCLHNFRYIILSFLYLKIRLKYSVVTSWLTFWVEKACFFAREFGTRLTGSVLLWSGRDSRSGHQNENTLLSVCQSSFDLSLDLCLLSLKAVGATFHIHCRSLIHSRVPAHRGRNSNEKWSQRCQICFAYDVCARRFLSFHLIWPPDYLLFNFPIISGDLSPINTTGLLKLESAKQASN